MGFVEAVEHLTGGGSFIYNRLPQPKANAPPEKPFKLPPRNQDDLRVIAYLQTRGIGRDLIQQCLDDGTLYESASYHNCVFVGRDAEGVARFAAQRGTMSNFKGDVAGSDKRYGFVLPAERDGGTVAVFEDAIDALSMATMFKASDIEQDADYLSLGGTSPLALEQYLRDHPDTNHIALCLDNDQAGHEAANRIARQLAGGYAVTMLLPSVGKDWNEALMTLRRQERNQQRSRENAALSL
jgi:hypothetical protein